MTTSTPRSKPSTTAVGRGLEERIARALERVPLHRPVLRNVVLRDAHGNRSEIDVAYGPAWRRRFVECKAYHGSGASVGLEEVAKFKAVLALNGISARRGLFITTSTFSPRAGTIGVRTLDGAGLVAWERRLRLQGAALRAGAAVGRALAWAAVAAAAAMALPPEVLAGGAPGGAQDRVHAALVVQRAAVSEGCAEGWRGGPAAAPPAAVAPRSSWWWGGAIVAPKVESLPQPPPPLPFIAAASRSAAKELARGARALSDALGLR